jgi:hypothetical protein
MTVVNTNYSTLEEAWGTNFVNNKGSKKKKKFVQDPLCDLYAKKSLRMRKPYSDDVEPSGVDDSMYGLFNKNFSSRNTTNQGSKMARTPQYKPVVVDGFDSDTHDAVAIDDDDAYLEKYLDEDAAAAIESTQNRRHTYARSQEQARQLDAELDRDKLIDLGLYIASGILMIFTMEQVLQLGIRMGDR